MTPAFIPVVDDEVQAPLRLLAGAGALALQALAKASGVIDDECGWSAPSDSGDRGADVDNKAFGCYDACCIRRPRRGVSGLNQETAAQCVSVSGVHAPWQLKALLSTSEQQEALLRHWEQFRTGASFGNACERVFSSISAVY